MQTKAYVIFFFKRNVLYLLPPALTPRGLLEAGALEL